MTQREAAALIGASERQWTAWETGKAPIKRVLALALEALNIRRAAKRLWASPLYLNMAKIPPF